MNQLDLRLFIFSLNKFALKYISIISLLFLFCLPAKSAVDHQSSHAGYLIHLLNYLGNDYKSAVENGKIKSEDEYAEMKEFAHNIVLNANKVELDENQKEQILTEARKISDLVDQLKPAVEVRKACNDLKEYMIKSAGIKTYPLSYPSIASGKAVFMSNCAKCHGDKGYGDGKEGIELNPPPRNFHDEERMLSLSAFNVYNTIKYGIEGTGMKSHPELSEVEVWDVAFYVLSLRSSANDKIDSPSLSLAQIATLTNAEIDEKLGENKHLAIRTWQPTSSTSSLEKSKKYISEAKSRLLTGDFEGVDKLLTLAYLDCIEPNETLIKEKDPNLVPKIERKISDIKKQLKAKESAGSMQGIKELEILLEESYELGQKTTLKPLVTLFMTISVLLREGLEALLIIIIFMSVLAASGAQKAKKIVHLGWISAITVGVILWFLLGKLLSSQKWNMELLEGTVTLVSVILMIYVGLWLHKKSSIDKWKEFIQSKLKNNAGQTGLWSVFTLAFLVVFREIFESILLVSSIDLQGKGQFTPYIIAGCIISLLIVIILYQIMTKLSKKLPFKQLISFSIIMLCILAVILTGKAIHSFQEAGVIGQSFLQLPSIDLLGFFPTWQTILPQFGLGMFLIWMFSKIKNA